MVATPMPPADPAVPIPVGMAEAAQRLGVSPATVRNWIRQAYLTPTRIGRRLRFDPLALTALQAALDSGALDRLRRRANKGQATTSVIPTERLSTTATCPSLERLVAAIFQSGVPAAAALFSVTLQLLAQHRTVTDTLPLSAFTEGRPAMLPRNIGVELADWFQSFDPAVLQKAATLLSGQVLPHLPDLLGLLYQSLQSVGETSRQGAYYTPPAIAAAAAGTHITPHHLPVQVLDPCCGTGQFLLAAADRLQALGCTDAGDRLVGMDLDPLAVRIARLNLMLRFPERPDYRPRIVCGDALQPALASTGGADLLSRRYDLILSNPPWGAAYTSAEIRVLQAHYPDVTSGESFAYFLRRGLQLLQPGGVLSYVLPESLLNVRTHQDIRTHLARRTTLLAITPLGRAFRGVFTPVIRLDIANQPPAANHQVHVREPHRRDVAQARFQANPDCRFDLQATEADRRILERLHDRPFVTLRDRADWALGIVTGNNGAFLSDVPATGYEPIIEGRQIDPYTLRPAGRCIRFDPARLQQVAPEVRYRAAEKLVYRFISRRVIVAYDDRQRLTLNSANIVIPRLEAYPIKAVLTLLNSALCQFVFQKQFAALKVLRNHLEALPLPMLPAPFLRQLVESADRLITGTLSVAARRTTRIAIDQALMQALGFTEAEIRYVQASVGGVLPEA
ncbi:MAG: N-6 DNA methylase [Candidatus Sericytochromatia bacterium]|nr:N-6 DNA methylase [Candidatus Sericytochromatia bacterium]